MLVMCGTMTRSVGGGGVPTSCWDSVEPDFRSFALKNLDS